MTTFDKVNNRIGFHFSEVMYVVYKFPHRQNTSVWSLTQIKNKNKRKRNKLLLKAKNEITFKPIARQKENRVGGEGGRREEGGKPENIDKHASVRTERWHQESFVS